MTPQTHDEADLRRSGMTVPAADQQGGGPGTDQPGDLPQRLRQIDVALLQPGRYQPRHRFPPEALVQLAASIRSQGLVQPVLVRPLAGTAPQRYEIIAGERRWRAAQQAGLRQVPALVSPLDDRTALLHALVENLQREDLNPVDEARGIARLIREFQLTHEEAARRLGRSRDSVTHLLRILTLDAPVLARVEAGELSLGHAKLLVGLAQAVQQQLASEVVRRRLSVRALEQRLRALHRKVQRRTDATPRRDPNIVRLEQRVGELLGATTRIDFEAGRGRGEIAFTFHSLEALDGILERLGYRAG